MFVLANLNNLNIFVFVSFCCIHYSTSTECGKLFRPPNKEVEQYSDTPWNAAIYDNANLNNSQPVLICGGTIISPQLVLSAAHCFYDETIGRPFNTSSYEIAVGKYSRDYAKTDNSFTKKHKVQQVLFSKKGYFGASNSFASDIAILKLADKISFSSSVQPACVAWTDCNDYEPETADISGRIVGWGVDENGYVSDIPHVSTVTYLGYKECLKTGDPDFRSVIPIDKFCGKTLTGLGVHQGDGGAGLVFRDSKSGLYFLRGIVSIRPSRETPIAAYTDVARYVAWINSVNRDTSVENKKSKA